MSKMLEKILAFADEYEMLPESGLVLVCVSGGADSMCLLEAMLHVSYERGFSVAVVHYNHGLRGAESDRDEFFVREYCEACGVPFYTGDGDVRGFAGDNGLSIEAAAREMRYRFFYETAELIGAERIATAHTADDNTETIIMNLTRGAGTNGLSGIPPVRGAVIRPLLRVSRDEVMGFIDGRGIPFVEDSTNSLDIYTRNKIRHCVIPVLKEINPGIVDAAGTAAELLYADEDFIADIADLFIQDCCAGLTADAGDLLRLPFAVSSRVIRKLYGGSLSLKHVKAVLRLCGSDSPSASLSLPGMEVCREYDRIVFNPGQAPSADGFAQVFPSDGDSFIILGAGLKMSCMSIVCSDKIGENGGQVTEINKTFTSFLFKSVDICGKIAVRPRREGDFIRLPGQAGTKSLKKLFIERHIPARKRAFIPVIADDEGVLAVYGAGRGTRAEPAPGDIAMMIGFEEI